MIYTILGALYQLHIYGLHMLLLVFAAIGCYAMSLAPVTWVLISEIFPTRVRGSAMSLTVTALWTASFLITYGFPLINHMLGMAGSFWLFAVICAAGFLYLRTNLRETGGKSLEEIEANWL